MSYGNYGSSSYSLYGGRRPRRSSGGSYCLTPSYSSSYLSPSLTLGSLQNLTGRRYDYSSDRLGLGLIPSKSTSLLRSDYETVGQTERSRQRYGSSSSIPDTASETSSRSDVSSRYSSVSQTSLNEEKNKEYQKLYEEMKKENERLKDTLKKTEEELDRTKKQLQKVSQNNMKSSLNETEKKERRTLERRISEMEEELKLIEKLQADNDRLSNENKALIRVISKLSK